MTAPKHRICHVGLAVAPHEVEATAAGVRHAFALLQTIAPGTHELALAIHDRAEDLPSLPSLDCALLSAAGEPEGMAALDLRRIWGERVVALAARGAVVLMLNQFRCVTREQPGHSRELFRIRQLNREQILLAQASDFVLVDVDNVMADLGGLYLGCDHRLKSTGGRMAVAYTVAYVMLKSGLRNIVEPRSLDGALKLLGGLDELRATIGHFSRPKASEPHG